MNKAPYILFTLVIAVAFGLVIVPDYVLTPDREAKASSYYDAEQVFSRTTTHQLSGGETYQTTDIGSCPDLSMETAKALSDKRLTISEVHRLGVRAHELHQQASALEAKNAALIAAGLKPLPNSINCLSGDTLF